MTAVPAPVVLREYALLADGERGALLGPRGEISWLCVPRWDSPSVFGTLVGGRGHYTLTPQGRYVWGGAYEEGTLIWRSRWVTDTGIVECREALAFPPVQGRTVLLRRVMAVRGDASVRVTLCPRAGYDREPLTDLHREDGVWTGRSGDLRLRWTGAGRARAARDGESLTLRLDVPAGGRHDLVLELAQGALPERCQDADDLWSATESNWQRAVPARDDSLCPSDTRHTYAVLRGLTSSSGGMVAAATTSLPERAEAGRNYDYRYVWIRDQCYAGTAVAASGGGALLDDAVRFVADRVLEHGPDLAPAYAVDGGRVPDQRHLNLPGYPGGTDIVGNWVNNQFQLDAFGEALHLFAAAAGLDRLDDAGRKAVDVVADAIAARWTEPDAGVWEIEPRAWTHSRLTAVSGLRAAAGLDPGGRHSSDWLALADRILADTSAHALHPDGHWQRAPDDPRLDAALLLPGLRGAVPADDPRTVATLHAYLRDLTRDEFAYRFRHDERPLHQAEGAFLLCGFWLALALDQQGDDVAARAWFERTRASCGPPQLFSEEYDTRQHQLRGNLPQAFVHALMLEAAARLAR